MSRCRLCEEIELGDPAPIDGLCAGCHINLCQKGVEKCVRCAKIVDAALYIAFENPFKEEKEY